MSRCPICDNKAANCDCTSTEREQYEEIEELEQQVGLAELRGFNSAIEKVMEIIEGEKGVWKSPGGHPAGGAALDAVSYKIQQLKKEGGGE